MFIGAAMFLVNACSQGFWLHQINSIFYENVDIITIWEVESWLTLVKTQDLSPKKDGGGAVAKGIWI